MEKTLIDNIDGIDPLLPILMKIKKISLKRKNNNK
jgi:hypothetical protein